MTRSYLLPWRGYEVSRPSARANALFEQRPPEPAMKLDRPAEARLSLRDQLRRAWARVRGGELTPARTAWSVALGLFVGVQPTPGFHLPIILAVCLPLRLDAAVAYLAANISIPPIAPFLVFTAIQIGSRLRT